MCIKKEVTLKLSSFMIASYNAREKASVWTH